MPKAVFFDMDGTITHPNLDFKALRRSVGVPDGVSIMGHIESLGAAAKQQAAEILAREEFAAAEQSELNPGVHELLDGLGRHGVRRALITNNHRRAMRLIVDRYGLSFELLLSREDAPVKPAPDLLQKALQVMGLDPCEACFVGDGRFDQMASDAAGVRYIHLSPDGSPLDGAPVITHLGRLWSQIGLRPPEISPPAS
jgi:HAD superfamily hydrolase (TIGR01509 family)